MSIGETLARARRDAGLSIAEVSSQTHIGLSVIDDIEHDDYSACGGDRRARANIAAIARALGVDSGPLIRAYNAAGRPAGWIVASEPSEASLPEPMIAEASQPPAPEFEPAPEVERAPETERVPEFERTLETERVPEVERTLEVERAPEVEPALGTQSALEVDRTLEVGHAPATEPALETEPAPEFEPAPEIERMPEIEPALENAAEDTQPIAIRQPPAPVTAGEPARPLIIGESADPVVPVEAAILTGASGQVRRTFTDRRPLVWVALGGALVVAAALGGILLILGTNGAGAARHDFADGRHHTGGRAARTPSPSPTHSVRSPGRTRPGSRPAQALVPASIAAFGPGGTGQGDSPQLVHQALAGKAAAPWHSSWYTTAHFGSLQSGTGLLLDMGRSVTITSARIALGDRSGADLVLRVGSSPTLARLRPVAHAEGAGGVVQLKTAPTRGRYVLVWFTRLPQDQAGTFQASVYDIKLRGRP